LTNSQRSALPSKCEFPKIAGVLRKRFDPSYAHHPPPSGRFGGNDDNANPG
jgi:hypothetical protein